MKINLKDEFKIISKDFFKDLVRNHFDTLLTNERKYLISKLDDYDEIPDRLITDNEDIQDAIVWEKINNKRIVRLITRNVDILNLVNVAERKFTIHDIVYFLQVYPEKINVFNINLNEISQKEAYILFCLGHEFFLTELDIKKFDFTSREVHEIIKAHDFSDTVIETVDLDKLNGYQVAEVLINNGPYLVDVKKLSVHDWLRVLSKKPGWLELCDLELFKKCHDVYNIIQLITLIDKEDLSYLLTEKNFNQISAFGWEKLLIYDPDKYIQNCDFKKLNENNWKQILIYRPELQMYKE